MIFFVNRKRALDKRKKEKLTASGVGWDNHKGESPEDKLEGHLQEWKIKYFRKVKNENEVSFEKNNPINLFLCVKAASLFVLPCVITSQDSYECDLKTTRFLFMCWTSSMINE
jgi:hypothetical protein